jgi:hypothetical protein
VYSLEHNFATDWDQENRKWNEVKFLIPIASVLNFLEGTEIELVTLPTVQSLLYMPVTKTNLLWRARREVDVAW